MKKGFGTIIIRPHECDTVHATLTGGHSNACTNPSPIPPVFPKDGYTEEGVYIESFYEVYSRMSTTDRKAMLRDRIGNTGQETESESGNGTYEDPTLDARTGLYVGPYKLTTQGLKQGIGYDPTGNTTGNTTMSSSSTNGTVSENDARWYKSGTDFMVPDISGKFVLDYQYSITQAVTATTNIRNALSNAKFRWQEIEVASSNVQISGTDRRTVTLTLYKPLPKGLKWDITWTSEALTNEAGIRAATPGNWWFWTDGVQKPVIRVDRKSMDQRDAVHKVNNQMFVIGTGSNTITSTNFNTINFRIESETPGATLAFATIKGVHGAASNVNELSHAAITAAWTGTITDAGQTWSYFTSTVTGLPVNGTPNTASADPGTWILPNLLRKSINGSWTGDNSGSITRGLHYYELDESGQRVMRQGQGNLQLFRSYNRDATYAELNALPLPNTPTNNNSITTTMFQASKNYVVARATAPHNNRSIDNGFEGIFKTVVALSNANDGIPNGNIKFFDKGSRTQVVGGSNLANGSPSIPGFPLQLNSGDLRYYKMMNKENGNNDRILWISTEIVSPVYYAFFNRQNSSDFMAQPRNLHGDTGPLVSGGYGELTYSVRQDVPSWNY